MENYSMYLPSYSIGETIYSQIPSVCAPYGSAIVLIGGHRALAAAEPGIRKGIAGSSLRILEVFWYGGEASYENVERLEKAPSVRKADMIFAVGGGKALDTGKCLANCLGKALFTFPTIASTCAATTAVSIIYNTDGSFKGPHFFERPALHAFINTAVIAKAPRLYMWAGMGDTYAKYFESEVSSRGESLPHYTALGIRIARMCLDPILSYGIQALKDNEEGHASYELEQVVLSIVVTTGIVSNLVTAEHIIDYNTGLAHAVFYTLTAFPEIEQYHLHGEVVGYGVLVLLLVDGNEEEFERLYGFHREAGLPVKLSDIGLTWEKLMTVLPRIASMPDVQHNPYPVTEAMLEAAFGRLEGMGL